MSSNHKIRLTIVQDELLKDMSLYCFWFSDSEVTILNLIKSENVTIYAVGSKSLTGTRSGTKISEITVASFENRGR